MKRMKKSRYGWKIILTAVVSVIGVGCAGCGFRNDMETESGAAAEAGNSAAYTADAESGTGVESVPALQVLGEYVKEITPDDTDAAHSVDDMPEEPTQESVKENIENDIGIDTKEGVYIVHDGVSPPLLEELFSFEEDEYHNYMIITGIADEYRYRHQDIFWTYMDKYTRSFGETKVLCIPGDINGLPVRVIGENAFADMVIDRVRFPDSVQFIDPGAFKNTGIQDIELPEGLLAMGNGAFEQCRLESIAIPESVQFIDERVFAQNPALWTALIANNSAVIKEDAFTDCAADFLLCYGENGRENENRVAAYAKENGFASKEIFLSTEPVVHYHEEPLVLQPRIDNFFYGDYGDLYENWDEELWCSWEYDENAPNFGYSDWQWPGCSSWCGVFDFELEVTASSELASGTDRYSADNVTVQDRAAAWAEGVDGNGIGESLIYRQSCICGTDNEWDALCQWKGLEPRSDGFLRYTEICIVNGYAKDEKTWEENGRVKQLLLYVEDKPYAYLELEDTIFPQYFTLPEDDIKVLNGGMLEVRYEITEVYPGSLYEDTCLTGLIMEFSGRYAH